MDPKASVLPLHHSTPLANKKGIAIWKDGIGTPVVAERAYSF